MVRQGNAFVALTGPGLTEGVDEAALTTNALWEAVTGEPGAQTWFDTVQVIDRSEEAETKRKADNDRYYKELRARSEAKKKTAKKQPPTAAQRRYLAFLVSEVDVEHFDAELAKALKGTRIAKRKPSEEPAQVIDRLTKDTAHTHRPAQEPPEQGREPASGAGRRRRRPRHLRSAWWNSQNPDAASVTTAA